MPRTTLLSLLALMAVTSVLRAQEPAPPPVVVDGLRAVTASGYEAAIATWFKGSALEGDSAATASLNNSLNGIPEYFGRPVGFEVLKTYAVGTHLRRTYAILLFEGGPLYFRFTYYLGAKGWLLQHIDFNGDAAQVFPEALRLP